VANDRKFGKKDKATGGSEMTKFYVILGVVAVIGIGAVGFSVGSRTLGNTATAPIDVEGLEDVQQLVSLAQGITTGNEDARVTIIEFADFQCPGCGIFAGQVKPLIDQAYVRSGKTKFVFYDLPLPSLHPNAFLAARAGRCADDQGYFWNYHDVLFRNQGAWAIEADPTRQFIDYAEALGLDREVYATCLRSDAHAATVSANMRLAQELGINGTPTVMVNVEGENRARRLANYDFQAISAAVEEALAQVAAGPDPAGDEAPAAPPSGG
jgi:protein-disulfide isomerase